jgi:hypothetical protein
MSLSIRELSDKSVYESCPMRVNGRCDVNREEMVVLFRALGMYTVYLSLWELPKNCIPGTQWYCPYLPKQ